MYERFIIIIITGRSPALKFITNERSVGSVRLLGGLRSASRASSVRLPLKDYERNHFQIVEDGSSSCRTRQARNKPNTNTRAGRSA